MTARQPDDVLDLLGSFGVVPVVVIDDAARAEPLGAALRLGGLPCAEVTLRTPAALEALRVLALDPALLVGAGTVVRPSQVDQALAAGASFVVSPGFSAAVVAECQQAGVPVLPGVATATEIQLALDAGVEVVKFFPAEAAGGVRTLAALAAPFRDVRFVPTGGVTAAGVPAYLALPAVLAVGGSWLVAATLLADERFGEVTRLAAAAVDTVHRSRSVAPA
jgi:2-dehydro-3-deoxyphosphogluconate aldolase/(4S)-4-hydroxy-2-oxoglutarate aldolase